MVWRYWRVVLRYGHVKRNNEVSVARYIRAEAHYKITDIMGLVNNMPGVKQRGVIQIKEIDAADFEEGKEHEQDNFYLIKLFNYHPKKQINITS